MSRSASIRLDQFLKYHGLAKSGGDAKTRIQAGHVLVNGVVETRRSAKLRVGDVVRIDGREATVAPIVEDEIV